MKNKLPKPVKVILICVIGVLLCFALYYFIDEILNGSFVNWFEENYMITEYKYIEEAGNNGLVREPNYAKLKVFFLWAFVVTAKANGTHQTEQFHILDAINVYSQIGELNITN